MGNNLLEIGFNKNDKSKYLLPEISRVEISNRNLQFYMLTDSVSNITIDKPFQNQSEDKAGLVFYIPYTNNFGYLVTSIDNLKPRALITKTLHQNMRDKYSGRVYEASKDGMMRIVLDDNKMKILKMY